MKCKARFALRAMLAAVFAISFVPLFSQSAVANDETVKNDRIAELLSSGDFVEGEAIAIVRSHADVEAAPQAEGLAEVSSDAVEEAIQAEGVVSEEAAMRIRPAQDETFDVKLVVDHGRTTEQILRDLYADPDVISAEPNYITTEKEAFGDDYAAAGQEGGALAAGDGQGLSLSTQDAASNQGDLTSLQWPMDASLSTPDNANTPIVKPSETRYSLNVPGWKDGRTNEGAEANASGVVCVMDEGIDPTHPDLKDVLYKFSPEDQAKYHCGEYGYNASGDPYGTNYLRPCGSHGTHVAGIVAAQWNGTGVSGVAHGVKLISVNAFGGDGRDMHMSALVKGFQFLVDVSKDINLKAVNCSWGIKQPEFALTVMVNELGKKGVNTVIAAGNDHENLDETIDFGSSTVSSPYVITVNSAMANGKTSEFSSYGQTSTDVFAPGSNFMSTMAQEVTTEVEKETGVKSGYSKQIHYYPQATAEENRIALETFADASGVRVFKENPAIKADAEEISPTVDESNGYGDQCSLAVKLSSMHKPDEPIDTKYIQGMLSTNGYVYLAIPVASAEAARNVKWASVDVALGDTVDVGKTFKPAGGFDTLTCLTHMKGKDADEPVEVSAAASNKLDKGWGSAAGYTIYQTQWSNVTYNVDGLVGSYKEADERMDKGEEFVNSSQAGKTSLKNLGELKGVYAWQPDGASGKTYVIARIAIGMATSDNKPTDNTTLYIDNVSLGNADAFTGAYETMPGTSMAAPAVAGCLAVIAKDEASNSELTDDAALELRARERKAKLLASVDYDEDLSTLCRTGGRVNMEKYVDAPSKLAPLPQYATAEDGVLTITGWFFGENEGEFKIDGEDVTPASWGAEKITADVSSLSNGSHVATITNSDRVVSRIVFAHSDESSSAGGTPLYENTLAIPTSFPGHEKDTRIYGPMAGCGGSIYAQTASSAALVPEALWRYDIAKGEWSRHALPAGYSPETYAGTEPSWNALNSGGLVAYRDTLYLVGDYVQGEEKIDRLWQYDAEKDSWRAIDMKLPSSCGALCVVDGDLLFVGGTYSFTFSDIENVCAVRVDVDNRKLTPIKAKTAEQAKLMEGGQNQVAVASSGKIYEYQLISDGESQTTHGFFRLTYDRTSDTMAIEDLSAAYAKVGPALENSAEMVSKKAHVAIAGLPDGVAIIGVGKNEDGSYAIGQDTHIIYDDANEAETLERTSSYHRAFDPMATFYEGVLYVAGQNATEPDAMYFRSTKMFEVGKTMKEPTCTENGARELTCLYGKNKDKVFTETLSHLGHVWGEGEVTKAAAPGVAGVRTYTCSRCGETKAEPIAALPGGAVGAAYQVGGNAYKVTGKDTVTFAKAKNAKKATVPATVTINGKAYKVTAVAPKAFASAKKKLKNAVIGANVAKIDKGAFKGCKKLKTLTVKTKKLTKKSVKGCLKGSAVKTVKVKVGSKKANKTYAKKYKKIFTKKNCGKKVAVKA